jgi:hypothetical protein
MRLASTKPMLHPACGWLRVEDAKRIVTGVDTLVRASFATKTGEARSVKFLPVVTRARQKVSLAKVFIG